MHVAGRTVRDVGGCVFQGLFPSSVRAANLVHRSCGWSAFSCCKCSAISRFFGGARIHVTRKKLRRALVF
jgi:hypothetical protein